MSQQEGWRRSLDGLRRKHAKKFGGAPEELLGKLYRSFVNREGHDGYFSYLHRELGDRHLLVTNGLSNPSPRSKVGSGVEFFVESDEPLGAPIFASWLSNMLAELVHLLDHDLLRQLDHHKTISVELLGKGFPPAMRTQSGRVGALIGVPAPDYPTHLTTRHGAIRLVAATILLPDELSYCLQHQAWDDIATRLARAGHHHLSRQWRDPVLPTALAS